ncbi:MYND-type domain-containing protein [Mycena kentingensis (nom. inval.)]|nr:MYND-type domain-containing protein [Mycena kentingensis (nom. inval.)]
MSTHPALKRENLKKLPLKLRNIAYAACSESRTYEQLEAIYAYTWQSPPREIMASFLLVYYANLDPELIPDSHRDWDISPMSASESRDIRCATLAIDGVKLVLKTESPHALAPHLWLRVYPWFMFLHAHWDLHPERHVRSHIGFLAGVVSLAAAAGCTESKDPAGFNRVADSPGLWVAMGELWARSRELASVAPGADVEFASAMVSLMLKLYHDGQPSQKDANIRGVVDGVGGSYGHVAKAFLRQVKDIAQRQQESGLVPSPDLLADLCLPVMVMQNHLEGVGPGGGDALDTAEIFANPSTDEASLLWDALHRAPLVSALIRALGVVKQPHPVEPAHIVSWEVVARSGIICDVVMNPKNTAVVVRAGYLRAIAAYAPYAPYAKKKQKPGSLAIAARTMQDFLTQILAPGLHDPSVVSAIRQAVRGDRVLADLMSKPAFKTSALGMIWQRYSHIFDESAALLDTVEAKERVEKKACDNIQCGKIADASAFRRCICKAAYYCSKPCQARHWKFGGHRQVCRPESNGSNQSDELRLLPLASFRTSHRRFLRALVHRDYERHKVQIYTTQVKLLLLRGMHSHFFTLFNYVDPQSGGFPGIGVEATHFLDEANCTDGDTGPATLETLLRDARACPGIDAICLQAGIPGVSPPLLTVDSDASGMFQVHIAAIMDCESRFYVVVPLRSSSGKIFRELRRVAEVEGAEEWDDDRIGAEVRALLERCQDVEEIH